MIDGPDSRQQQRRDACLLHLRDDSAQVLFIGMRGKPVIDRGPAQAVAVRDLDQRHSRGIQSRRNAHHLLDRDLMALRMHAVAQTHVV